ncbi:MAG: signal peptidase II [bacterium]
MLVLIVICIITFLDQLTKILVTHRIVHFEIVPVVPGFFNLAHVHNTGAAFSMFHDSNLPLAAFSTLVLIVLVIFRRRIISGPLPHRLAMAMVIAGIIGNLLDRIKYASVVDILDFYSGVHHFPTFNIADSSICIGVVMYVVSAFFERQHGEGRGDSSTGNDVATSGPCGTTAGQLEANNDSSLHNA